MPDLGSTLKRAADTSAPPLDFDALVTTARLRKQRRSVAWTAVAVVVALVLAWPTLRGALTEAHLVGHTGGNHPNVHATPTPRPAKRRAHDSRHQGSLPLFRPGSSGVLSAGDGAGGAGGSASQLSLQGHIAFTDSNGVEVLDAATKRVHRVISTGAQVAAARDGSRLAYTFGNGVGYILGVVRADGTGNKWLANMDGKYLFAPAWSPDGSRILFVVDDLNSTGSVQPSKYSMWIVNADGSGLRSFNEIPASDAPIDPAWSPDGTKIAYASVNDETTPAQSYPRAATIKIYDFKTGRRTTVIGGNEPAWSPDGSMLAFQNTDQGIEVLDLATGARRILDYGEASYTIEAGHTMGPSFSPDGRVVAYTRSPNSDKAVSGGRLWYVPLDGPRDGSGGRQLLSQGSTPSWTP